MADQIPTPRGLSDSMDFEVLETPTTPVKLRKVALPLDAAERFQWRISAVLIALSLCRSKSSTVEHLHTLVWVINDPSNAQIFKQAWEGEKPSRRARGYVSGLLQTLSVAQAEGLIEQTSTGRQKLTPSGTAIVEEMRNRDLDLGVGHHLLTDLSPISSADMSRKLGAER